MNKEFPIDYVERKGVVFDVNAVADREIDLEDIDLALVEPEMFIAFYTGYIEAEGYGTKRYFSEHPQLSNKLIEALLEKKISIIGIDFAGMRRGTEHTPKDQYCAEKGIFVIENLCNLDAVLNGWPNRKFIANTYPVNYTDMTGLPCRVIAKL
jgi:kynurenine formamidase